MALKVGKFLKKFLGGFGEILSPILDFGLGWIKNDTWNLSKADKQAASISLRNQQSLNQEEYDRKLDFYERFESPEALVRQWGQVGVNPMALFGGSSPSISASGGIGSAGSADASSSASAQALPGIFSTILQAKQLKDRLKIDREAVAVQQQQAATAQYNAETERMYKEALTKGQNTTNEWLSRLYGAQVAQGESSAEVNKARAAQLEDLLKSQEVQRRLAEKNIEVADTQKLVNQYNAAILKAQEKYSDEYFKALAKIQTATSILQSGEAGIFASTLEKRKESAMAELNHIIIKAGMDAEILGGDAFKAQVEGRMTRAEKTQMWVSAGSSLVGAAVGAAAPIAGAKVLSASRMMSSAPMQQPMLYDAHGGYKAMNGTLYDARGVPLSGR